MGITRIMVKFMVFGIFVVGIDVSCVRVDVSVVSCVCVGRGWVSRLLWVIQM